MVRKIGDFSGDCIGFRPCDLRQWRRSHQAFCLLAYLWLGSIFPEKDHISGKNVALGIFSYASERKCPNVEILEGAPH